MDGNVGIGGDVARLLARVHSLLEPGGQLLVETATEPQLDRARRLRFSHRGRAVGPRFGWAEVGVVALSRYAIELDYTVEATWTVAGRTFAALTRSSARAIA
jgi:hypothetical protein